eukprot:2861277-Amphidinium_carterae.1
MGYLGLPKSELDDMKADCRGKVPAPLEQHEQAVGLLVSSAQEKVCQAQNDKGEGEKRLPPCNRNDTQI